MPRNLPLKRTALYMRLSRDDEKAGESLSIENQRAVLRAFVEENGGLVAGEYVDDGWSGTDFERPAVKRLLSDAKAGSLDTVVVKDLSRFGRNYIQTGQYIDYIFPAYGIRFIALNDNVDTFDRENPGMDMMPIMNVFNEWHAANTSKKIRAVLQASWRQGKFTGWAYPYGYKAGTDAKRTAVIDEEAAKTVRRIFALRRQGESVGAIARILTDDNVPNPRTYFTKLDGEKISKPCSPYWSARTVSNILNNSVYIGTTVQHKTTRFSYKNKITLKVPESEQTVYENAHKPIISMETWNAVRALDDSVSRGRKDSSGALNVLSGLMVCSDCGKKMKLRKSSGTSSRSFRGYACRTYTDLGKRYCSSHYIDKNVMEELLLRDLKSLAGEIDIDETSVRGIFEKKRSSQRDNAAISNEKELVRADGRIAEIKLFMQKAFEEKARGVISEELFDTLCERYDNEKKSLENIRGSINKRIAETQADHLAADDFVFNVKKFCRLEELTRETCIRSVELISVGEIPNSPDKAREIHIYYKFAKP